MQKDNSDNHEPDIFMELKLQTQIGELTAVFVCEAENCYQNVYTAWFKEKAGVVVQSISVQKAIDDLHSSLKLMLEVENKGVKITNIKVSKID